MVGRARAAITSPAGVVFAVCALIGGLARVGMAQGRGIRWWQDSDDYLDVASHGWFTSGLWAGERPPGVPLLLKLTGVDGHAGAASYGWAQMLLATLAWAALAASVTAALPSSRTRWVPAGAVLAVSLTLPVVMWERSVLSESPAVSLLVVILAAGIVVVRRPGSWAGPLAGAGALAAWVSLRDVHALLVLFGAAGACLWLLRRDRIGLPVAVLAGSALVCGAVATFGAFHADRGEVPLRNVYATRILPYPDRVEWFAARGMPQAEDILSPGFRPAPLGGEAPVLHVEPDTRNLQDWNAWFARDGRTMYARWLVSHPLYLVSEPFKDPERVSNNAGGSRGFYAPSDQGQVPLVDLVALRTAPALIVALVSSAWLMRRNLRGHPVAIVGWATLALSVPHGLIAWHGDGMEAARHLTVPALQVQMGTLLLVIAAVWGREAGGGARARSGVRVEKGLVSLNK